MSNNADGVRFHSIKSDLYFAYSDLLMKNHKLIFYLEKYLEFLIKKKIKDKSIKLREIIENLC